jgi:hypothetical protein
MYNYNYDQNTPAYNYDPQSAVYQQAYRRAAQRVRNRIGFYWHAASYVVVNGFLIAIYLLTSIAADGLYYPWFIWPMAAWGVGLLFNYLSVFVFGGTYDQQKMIEAEMRRMGVEANSTASYYPVDQK